MNQKQTKAAVEAMLFAAGDPVSADKLAAAVQLPQTAVETALEDLRARYAREDSGLCTVSSTLLTLPTINPVMIWEGAESLDIKHRLSTR